jgi:hypothetical protein
MLLMAHKALYNHPPFPTDTTLTAYGGTKIEEKMITQVTYQGVWRQVEFIIVKENVKALLCLPSIKEIGLIQQVHIMTEIESLQDTVKPWADV